MNYSEYRSGGKKKGVTAFYIVLACCLLAVGAATWFAAGNFDRTERRDQESEDRQSSVPSRNESNLFSSDAVSENVAKPVKDEPYTEPSEANSDKAETAEETAVFVVPVQGEVIKAYSDRELQYSATYGDMRLHAGMDISCEDGVSVSAAAKGTVVSVEESAELGTVISIDHGNGFTSRYASMKDAKVKAGDSVAAGDIIGAVGSIPGECADQSHLHFEILKDGHYADPSSLFPN